jgi:uroporphyrin-3 C-methyltransferase
MTAKKKTSKKSATGDESPDNVSSSQDDTNDVVEESAAHPTETQTSTTTRKSGPVAWLALLVSAVAILAVVSLWFLGNRDAAGDAAESSAEISALRSSIGATQEALTSLEQSITELGQDDAEKSAQIESISKQLSDRLRQLDALPGRLSSVEASMASIQGISTGARDAWLLAEAEYYMQIANAQLQLASNPELAMLALTHADDRILQLGDPRLTNIRQALSDELQALEVIDRPDIAGITLTLASLAGVVDSLPLRQEVVVSEDRANEIDPALTGMDRAMASLKNAVGGVVSVRRADEAMQPLIAPEAQYFLRANLALQFHAARLALLRGEDGVFRQSLDDADSWLGEYYDPASTGVQNARETITEIRDSTISVAIPDISQSLRLLRQFNSLNDAATIISDEPAQ